ncbi:MAG: bifunctional hydroxymethylpyrimidine kinase/phosphomethylpyrimidine kinase [Betaproteobacteria bacterium]|jgi:hydroxymethylpyrimidine/phosphomethylpyrimidine kinase|nr:bifunctional hydroxymethylpyrimidine kinase/phosphomethylpyrimidine kinase [Betaproteobacteria bacterium]NBP45365.1 bifunctional hydroxymethylpyrimidine kinase/phosphomethylpyrimidine kinase [Betaproteobacteria bacterium]
MSQGLTYPRVLTIAGSDSGGGAGIQADLKTCSAWGCYGMTAITALTAQNTQGVQGIHAVPPEFLAAQIDSVCTDLGVDAIKIGMLHMPEVVRVVVRAIERHQPRWVVLDPVMVATSGDKLIEEATVEVIVKELFPLVSVITPNLDEAAWLVGHAIERADDLAAAARELLAMGAPAVLLKGGHLPGPEVVDCLLTREGTLEWFKADRVDTRNMHGTGCTLSSALACALALGHDLVTATRMAKAYVAQALQHGALARIGQGHGPLNHGFAPQAMHTLKL